MAKSRIQTQFIKDDEIFLRIRAKDKGKPGWKIVKGVNFTKASRKDRQGFLKFYKRQLENYLFKGKTGNFSMHIVSKHDPRYGQTTKEEVEYWSKKGIIIL